MANRIDFSNLNTTSKEVLSNKETSNIKRKQTKSDKRVCIYLTSEQEEKLLEEAANKHLSIKDYILQKTIYA